MRIEAKVTPGWQQDWAVYLNGQRMRQVILADEELGYVEYYNDKLQLTKAYGEVVISDLRKLLIGP